MIIIIWIYPLEIMCCNFMTFFIYWKVAYLSFNPIKKRIHGLTSPKLHISNKSWRMSLNKSLIWLIITDNYLTISEWLTNPSSQSYLQSWLGKLNFSHMYMYYSCEVHKGLYRGLSFIKLMCMMNFSWVLYFETYAGLFLEPNVLKMG